MAQDTVSAVRPDLRTAEALVILLLVTALVLCSGLWAWTAPCAPKPRRAAGPRAGTDGGASIEWKLVTTWPKNLPGLGHTPEVFADMVAR
jgi:hypothetical protein